MGWRQKIIFRGANLIVLAIGLALTASGLLAWALTAGASQLVDAQIHPSRSPSAAAIVSGTISYVGAVTGTHLVWVGAFTTTLGGPPAYASQRNGPGPYTLTVEAGSYFIYAGMDADDSGGAPNPDIDPIGAYAHNPVTVTANAVMTGVDIVLRDPTPPPTGTANISGQISYTGRITVPHNIIVVAGRQGEQGPPAYAAVIPGPGPYTITNVADGAYMVAAFMDLGDDMGPPAPDEPFGWYDPSGDQQPDPVVVRGGVTATGIDIILHDPTPASQKLIFLPLVTKTYHDLSWFIPDQLAGYPQPMTASFARAEPLDGQAIPGGYAGREWLDESNQRFVLAMVMSWLTPQAATRQLGLLKPAHAVPAAVGDEGYIGETADTDGEPAFRLLVFRRGSYLVLVGSGVLDHAATAPVQRVIMDLGEQIDARLSGVPASALATALDQDSPAQ